MVKYMCNRCGYIAKQKTHLLNHLNRKNICIPLLEDISIEEMKFTYGFEMNHNKPKLNHNEPKMNHNKENTNEPKMNHSEPKMNPNEPKNIQLPKNKEYICSYCSNSYSTNSHMRRHEKTCKLKKENENEKNLKKQVEELKEMVEKLLINNTGNTTTNNTNSNNTIHNTININNYGEENTKYITSDYILNLLKFKPAKAIPELIKHTHFNEEHPENQNIKITNKKGPHIKVMKNNKWELQDKEETITDLIDRQQVHLLDEEIEEKIEEKCSNIEKGNIDRCSGLYNNEDKDYMKRLYNESELIIINNS